MVLIQLSVISALQQLKTAMNAAVKATNAFNVEKNTSLMLMDNASQTHAELMMKQDSNVLNAMKRRMFLFSLKATPVWFNVRLLINRPVKIHAI